MESEVSQFVSEKKVAGLKGLVNVFCLTMERLDRRHLVEVAEQSHTGLAAFSFTPR